VPVPAPAPQSAPVQVPATPTPPAGVGDGHVIAVPAVSVPQPDTALQAAQTAANLSSTIRPDAAVAGQSPIDRPARHRAHRQTADAKPARASRTGGVPIAHTAAVRSWSPVHFFETTSRRGTQPAAPARRSEARGESRGARHLVPPRPHPRSAVIAPPTALPLSATLPPGGGEGSAAGAGGASGAAAVALLALFGICILRALLPGLLGLGLAPARSAFLVWRLERPG
jgi:hypothetical protein